MKTLEEDTNKEEKVEKEETKNKPDMASKIINNIRKTNQFPSSIIKVDAINVYSNRWRVNVWTWGENNAKVEQSWFVESGPKGEILKIS